VLGIINSSPGDLAPVFDTMLERAMRLCGFDHGSLQTYDGELFRAVAVRGLPEQLAETAKTGLSPRAMATDAAVGGRCTARPRSRSDAGGAGGGSEACRRLRQPHAPVVPLRKDDALLGTIVAVRQEVRPFGDRQIALLENFAAQAVIAMGECAPHH